MARSRYPRNMDKSFYTDPPRTRRHRFWIYMPTDYMEKIEGIGRRGVHGVHRITGQRGILVRRPALLTRA